MMSLMGCAVLAVYLRYINEKIKAKIHTYDIQTCL